MSATHTGAVITQDADPELESKASSSSDAEKSNRNTFVLLSLAAVCSFGWIFVTTEHYQRYSAQPGTGLAIDDTGKIVRDEYNETTVAKSLLSMNMYGMLHAVIALAGAIFFVKVQTEDDGSAVDTLAAQTQAQAVPGTAPVTAQDSATRSVDNFNSEMSFSPLARTTDAYARESQVKMTHHALGHGVTASSMSLAIEQSNPDGKHVILSYQKDGRRLAKRVQQSLIDAGIPVYCEEEDEEEPPSKSKKKKNKAKASNKSAKARADAIQVAAVIIPFMTARYQDSRESRRELSYADQKKAKIFPVIARQLFVPTDWLGVLTAGMTFYDLSDDVSYDSTLASMIKRIKPYIPKKKMIGDRIMEDAEEEEDGDLRSVSSRVGQAGRSGWGKLKRAMLGKASAPAGSLA